MRFGALRLGDDVLPYPLVALAPVPCGEASVLRMVSTERNLAHDVLTSIVLRAIAVYAEQGLRCAFIDAAQYGAAAERFMVLNGSRSGIVVPTPATDASGVERLLDELLADVERIGRTKLQGQHADLEAYNAQSRSPEPYKLLTVFACPVGFNESSIGKLATLCRTGPRCGIYPAIGLIADAEWPRGCSPDDICNEDVCVLEPTGDGRELRIAKSAHDWPDDLVIIPDEPPAAELHLSILRAAERRNLERPSPSFDVSTLLHEEDRWSRSSGRELRFPVGLSNDGDAVDFVLDSRERTNVAIAGRIGSGKSNFLHVLISTATHLYPPGELELFLVDLKLVSFERYADGSLPHAQIVCNHGDREFALNVLETMRRRLDERAREFGNAGVEKLDDFRQATGRTMPRSVVIIDEFQELLRDDDALAGRAATLLDQLIRLGRAFGIHIVLCSQSLQGASRVARTTLDQISVRVALPCSEQESLIVLGEGNKAGATLVRAGQAIINDRSGALDANREIQVPEATSASLNRTIADLRRLADERGMESLRPRCYDGAKRPAYDPAALPLAEPASSSGRRGRRTRLLIGEPVGFGDPVLIELERSSGEHVGIFTSNEDDGLDATLLCLLSILNQTDPTSEVAPILLIDGSFSDAAETAFGDIETLYPRLIRVGDANDAVEFVTDFAGSLDERAADRRTLFPARFLVIHGLQNVRELRPRAGTGSYSRSEPGELSIDKKLANVITDGSALGLHVLFWCDTWSNAARTFERSTVGEISKRVAFPTSTDDSHSILGTQLAGQLPDGRAVYSNDGKVVKFRPMCSPATSAT